MIGWGGTGQDGPGQDRGGMDRKVRYGKGWEGQKGWDRTRRERTTPETLTSLSPAQFGLVWGLLELDLLMVLHTAICVGVLE